MTGGGDHGAVSGGTIPPPWRDLRLYGVPSQGTAAIRAAVSAIGKAEGAVLLAGGPWVVKGVVTIPHNVSVLAVPGGSLDILAGGRVRLLGPLSVAATGLFRGPGRVVLGERIAEVHPDWWARPTDRERIQAAIDTGKDVILSRTYDLGRSTSHDQRLLEVRGRAHQRLVGRGPARLVCHTAAPAGDPPKEDIIPRMIDIVDSSFIEVCDLAFEDAGVDDASYERVPRIGAAGVHIAAFATGSSNISLRNLHFRHLIHAIAVNRDRRSVPRVHSISIDNVRSERVRYGINFQNNGDHLSVRNFSAVENVRSYFVYGVADHDVQLSIVSPRANDADINIAHLGNVYQDGTLIETRDTKRIKVRARATRKSSVENALVVLGHDHPGDASALISDIDLDIDLRDGGNGRMVRFVSWVAGDEPGSSKVAEPETDSRWENIRIRGVDVAKDAVITWASIPRRKVGIELSPEAFHFGRLDNKGAGMPRNFDGCYLTDGGGRRIHFAEGRLSEQVVRIDLSQFTNQRSVLRITAWAMDDARGDHQAGDRHHREESVFLYIAQTGVTVVSRKEIVDHVIGRSSGLRVEGAPGLPAVDVTFPAYDGPDARGTAVVEVVLY